MNADQYRERARRADRLKAELWQGNEFAGRCSARRRAQHARSMRTTSVRFLKTTTNNGKD